MKNYGRGAWGCNGIMGREGGGKGRGGMKKIVRRNMTRKERGDGGGGNVVGKGQREMGEEEIGWGRVRGKWG